MSDDKKHVNRTRQQMATFGVSYFYVFLRQTHFAICIFLTDFRTKVIYAREGRAFVAILEI